MRDIFGRFCGENLADITFMHLNMLIFLIFFLW